MKRSVLPKILLLSFALLLFIAGCSDNGDKNKKDETKVDGNYPNAQLLVDAKWLEENIDDDKLFIIDARGEGFEAGHIPGAVAISAGQLNDASNDIGGFLLDEATFTNLLQEAGLNSDATIVVYDDGNALSATRVFYALEYYGLRDKVKVLEAGYPAWLTAGYDINTGEAEVKEKGDFVAKANDSLIADRADVEGKLNADDVVFLDARSPEEYSGEDLRDNKRGGHIPGAVNRDWTEALVEGDDGLTHFLPYEELKANFEDIGVVKEKKVVPYCQTNVRGAHSYFALRLLDYEDIQPYEGSWAEWGNSEDTEIEG